ncbi:hypothetical protein CTI12_AA321300 [Artemisia annua]|uniref:Uncharacterized protein n=1 Tax=Artemisia annua TaxID=35608 RepID=A0A2U1N0M9_ARTAN|nr:hypothetical protein CTI12_AA321300 [Artemisia annua]
MKGNNTGGEIKAERQIKGAELTVVLVNHYDLLSSVSYQDAAKWARPLARRNCTDSIVEVGTTLFASNKDVLHLQV